MRILRCHTPRLPDVGQTFQPPEEEQQHLTRVLRLREGMVVHAFDGAGRAVEAVAERAGGSHCELRVLREIALEKEPSRMVALALALTRTDAFDDCLERAIELGITDFIPLSARFSVVELDERRTAKRLERWRRLAVESLKQCERLWLPDIHPPMDPVEMLELASEEGLHPIVLAERTPEAPPLHRVLADLGPGAPVAIIVGPEGGWSPEERSLFAERCRQASMGGAILRSETVAIGALALALHGAPA